MSPAEGVESQPMSGNVFSADELTQLATRVLCAAGAPEDIATDTAEVLVNSNLAGHDSHGVMRLPSYLQSVDSGDIVLGARPDLSDDGGAVLSVNGNRGLGHHTARKAMSWAVAAAKRHGVAVGQLLRDHSHRPSGRVR